MLGKWLGGLSSRQPPDAGGLQPRLELEAEANTAAACLWARVPVITLGTGITSVVSHGAEATVGGRRSHQRCIWHS